MNPNFGEVAQFGFFDSHLIEDALVEDSPRLVTPEEGEVVSIGIALSISMLFQEATCSMYM